MNRFKFYLAVGLAFVVGLLPNLYLTTASAQTVITDTRAEDVKFIGRGYGTISTNILGIVKYVGPEACGDVAVAAGGDITFQDGTCGAEVADTALECDSSIAAAGSRSGVFDLSTPHANCDTWGEVADLINASGSWIFMPIGVRRSDSTDNVAITLSEIDATTAKGIALLKDDTTALNTTINLSDLSDTDIRDYMEGGNDLGGGGTIRFKTNPWKDSQFRLIDWVDTVTTSGATTLTVLCSASTFNATTGAWAESVTTIWTSATAATTAQFTKTFPYLKCPGGNRMLVRISSTTDHTAATAFATGTRERARN